MVGIWDSPHPELTANGWAMSLANREIGAEESGYPSLSESAERSFGRLHRMVWYRNADGARSWG